LYEYVVRFDDWIGLFGEFYDVGVVVGVDGDGFYGGFFGGLVVLVGELCGEFVCGEGIVVDVVDYGVDVVGCEFLDCGDEFVVVFYWFGVE